MRIFTSDTMRSIDHKTISEGHVEGRILMERAGLSAAQEILSYSKLLDSRFSKSFVIVCGKGNNGGDGFVIAGDLISKGKTVKILSVCEVDELSGDALYHAKRIVDKVDFDLIKKPPTFEAGDFIIDCLLGTGLSSDVREPYSSIIESINKSTCPVAAVDIASGLDGNTGEVHGVAVKADITLTIGFPKTGLFQKEGPEYTGRLKCIDIGFPEKIADQFESFGELLCENELRAFFSRRNPSVHKYNCGNVLIAGGSKNYGGAPFLAGYAAARSGAGMLSIAFPDSVNASGPDALIKIPLDSSKEGTFSKKSALDIRSHLDKKNVVVLGPGMTGSSDELFIVETIMNSDKIVVADAGALIHLARNSDLIKREKLTVLTPHTGELRRLLEGTGLKSAEELAKTFNAYVLVKGQFSELFTPDGKMIKNCTGCNSLATAGSGDVLSGIIGAFLSWSNDSEKAISHAVAVHGLCGEKVPSGNLGAIADDFIENIPVVLKSISPYN